MSRLPEGSPPLTEPPPDSVAALSGTYSELSHQLHRHLALAQDAQASNRALQALLGHAKDAAGASGFAGVTQQLVGTNRNLQEYTHAVGEAIGAAVGAFQELESTVRHFEQEFVLLRDRINAIQASTQHIMEIAMKSRMVSISASIQAAHIGSVGSGFAVVAHEVRDLSARTEEISEEVRRDLVAVEIPLKQATLRFEENQQSLERAKAVIEGLETTAYAMLGEAHALATATGRVESIAFKQVEIQDHLDGIGQHTQWISQAADSLVPELSDTSGAVDNLWELSMPPSKRAAVADLQQFESELFEAIRDDQPRRARHAVESALHGGLDLDELVHRVSAAATAVHLEQLGRDLPTETLFRNARILEDVINALQAHRSEGGETRFVHGGGHRPVVVLGNAFEDHHDLGRRLVAMRMRSAGFEVIDLGLSVSNESFIEAAREHQADVIGVSALLLHTAVWIPKLKEGLLRAGLGHIKVIAGGAPFLVDPLLKDEFGADGVAGNPNEAVRLVSALVNREPRRRAQ